MKKHYLLLALVFITCRFLSAQIICIRCIDQNDSVSHGINNLLQNGDFENSTCSTSQFFCPNSSGYSCDIANWTCTGGGTATYAQVFTNINSVIPSGSSAAYLGNFFCSACPDNDTTCLNNVLCETVGIPSGFPNNTSDYGGSTGVSLSQTVTGLTVGNIYELEFWAGGEGSFFIDNGLFGVDLGFGYTYLRCKPTDGVTQMVGTRFIIEFRATAASHTVKFTNWGHICSYCSELVLDDVRLYPVGELAASVPPCDSSYFMTLQTNGTVCGQCNGEVKAYVFNGNPPYHYAWSNGDTTQMITGVCVGSYGLTVSDALGNTLTDAATVIPSPVNQVAVTVDNTVMCPGDSVYICAPAGFTNYSWSNGQTAMCFYTGVPGNYEVTVSDNNNCSATSNRVSVSVLAPPPVLVSVNGASMTAYNAVTYQWYLNGNLIAGATSALYVADQPGNYQVGVTDANGCSALSNGILYNTVDELYRDPSVSLYPNPANNELNIVPGNNLQTEEVRFYSSDGKLVSEVKLPLNNRIDISSFAAGVYVAEIKLRHSKIRLRWVKL